MKKIYCNIVAKQFSHTYGYMDGETILTDGYVV